jgi:hypothetical protein
MKSSTVSSPPCHMASASALTQMYYLPGYSICCGRTWAQHPTPRTLGQPAISSQIVAVLIPFSQPLTSTHGVHTVIPKHTQHSHYPLALSALARSALLLALSNLLVALSALLTGLGCKPAPSLLGAGDSLASLETPAKASGSLQCWWRQQVWHGVAAHPGNEQQVNAAHH